MSETTLTLGHLFVLTMFGHAQMSDCYDFFTSAPLPLQLLNPFTPEI